MGRGWEWGGVGGSAVETWGRGHIRGSFFAGNDALRSSDFSWVTGSISKMEASSEGTKWHVWFWTPV